MSQRHIIKENPKRQFGPMDNGCSSALDGGMSQNSVNILNIGVYHGRIDWDVAKRLLQVIYADAPIGKTSLAMKAGVNYSTCKKYATWLKEVDWIAEDNNDRIRLAEAGLQVYFHMLHQLQ